MNDPHAELVRLARRGNDDAARELFALAWPEAVRTARTVLGATAGGDDVAQTAMIKAFRALPRFDNRRPFLTWLRRIVTNEALNARRTAARNVPLDAGHAAPPDPTPEGLGGLWQAVCTLPADRHAVVALRFGLDLTPSEIADVLELPVGTVKSRLARALADLRRELEDVYR